jgi:predicted RNase H-like HicB family nuclease
MNTSSRVATPCSRQSSRGVQGKTVEEAMERAAEAISVHIAGLEADGEAVPEEREPPHLVTVTVAA